MGLALGITFFDLKKIIGLGLAGALGFGIGMLIMYSSSFHPWTGWDIPGNIKPWLGWVLWGVIGGTCLGATLGYLEKKKVASEGD